MADKSIQITDIPKRALGVAAHPDDLDFMASGTFAKWASEGCEVYYLILTDGSKGSADRAAKPTELTKTRRLEQLQAARIVGAKDVMFMDYEDGTLTITMELKRAIVRVIRTVKPDVLVTMDPCMLYDADFGFINHPDHRAAGQAALDAVFPLARDHLSFPELYQEEGLEPHSTSSVLLTNFTAQNSYVDISDAIETKMNALTAHASQMSDLDGTKKMMRGVAAEAGKQIGSRYAEGFVQITIR